MSLEEHIAEQRDAKATTVVRWLEQTNTTVRVCRSCWQRIARDDDGAWLDEDGGKDCGPFMERGLHVTHRPETWTPVRVANATPEERTRIGVLAGVKRKCSDATWERVAVLFAARVDASLSGDVQGGS